VGRDPERASRKTEIGSKTRAAWGVACQRVAPSREGEPLHQTFQEVYFWRAEKKRRGEEGNGGGPGGNALRKISGGGSVVLP